MTELLKGNVIRKRILCSILALNLESSCTMQNLLQSLGMGQEIGREAVIEAMKSGLATLSENDTIILTKDGRSSLRVVFSGGVFDIIHPGHIYTLYKARALGDMLIV